MAFAAAVLDLTNVWSMALFSDTKSLADRAHAEAAI
jgi:hypothetical protein